MSTTSMVSTTLATMAAGSPDIATRAQESSLPENARQTSTPTIKIIQNGIPKDRWAEQNKISADANRANATFQVLTDAYNSLMSNIKAQRPDIASQKFDFVTTQSGTLQVESDTLSASDKTWLQQKLNADATLVVSAKSFNASLVKSYSTDRVGTFDNGMSYILQIQQDLHTSYNYQGLGNSINGSIKFVSLMNDISNYWTAQDSEPQVEPGNTTVVDPSSMATNLAQNYLQANIKQYVQGTDGSWQPVERKGFIMSVFA